MPANKKYLSSSPWQRFAKISAGLLGGYLISASFHMTLAYWLPNHKLVLITSIYTIFLLWMVLLIVPFMAKNGWKLWGLYLILLGLFSVLTYYGKIYSPIS